MRTVNWKRVNEVRLKLVFKLDYEQIFIELQEYVVQLDDEVIVMSVCFEIIDVV